MHKKCIWSNQKNENLKELEVKNLNTKKIETVYVLPEFEQEFLSFYKFAEKYANKFLIAVISLSFAFVFVLVLPKSISPYFLSLGLVLMGILCYLFPFVTPETVKMIGMKKSILTAKVLGIIIALFGTFICFKTMSF